MVRDLWRDHTSREPPQPDLWHAVKVKTVCRTDFLEEGVTVRVLSASRDTPLSTYEEVDHALSPVKPACSDRVTDGVLVLVTYGQCRIARGNRTLHLNKGDLLLCTHVEHPMFFLPPASPHEEYTIRFSYDALDNLPILHNADKCTWRVRSEALFLDRFKRIYHHFTEGEPYSDILCRALVTELLVHLNREIDRGLKSQAQNVIVSQMLMYIRTHRREKVTKLDLARHVERSPGYVATLFQSVTGKTISEYLHEARVEMALQLLRESQLTVGDIAEFLGYSDAAYFHKVFKRITGHRPKDYFEQRPRPRS